MVPFCAWLKHVCPDFLRRGRSISDVLNKVFCYEPFKAKMIWRSRFLSFVLRVIFFPFLFSVLPEGDTPLMLAVESELTSAVRLLLNEGGARANLASETTGE